MCRIEGIIKAAVKPVVHSFMGTGTFTESQPCEEETDEPNDHSQISPLEDTPSNGAEMTWLQKKGEHMISAPLL